MNNSKDEALGRRINLRRELLMLAGLIGPGEALAASDIECDLGAFVGRACAIPGLTVTAAALMACCIARYVEEVAKE